MHLGLLSLTLMLLMAPFASEAQQAGKVPRIGVLSGSWPPPRPDPCLDRLRQGFADLGHVEGRTYVLEPKWAEGLVNPYPRLAADLVRLNVDVIVSFTSPGNPAAKQATSTIPIIMASILRSAHLRDLLRSSQVRGSDPERSKTCSTRVFVSTETARPIRVLPEQLHASERLLHTNDTSA